MLDNDSIRIAAVVATCDRPDYLANRSLASISKQTRPPDLLAVVDDSNPKSRTTNREIVTDFAARHGVRVAYLENYRTPGASGAWNTALAHLQKIIPACFAAILDDDDAWEPTYLQRCQEAALEHNLDMVAAGLLWCTSPDDPGRPLAPPDRLASEDFFPSNPHIQGSNLFIRLRTLLEAGGFDEALHSTTDRDLCIRLADLGRVRFQSLQEYLVRHYAEDNRRRLSSRGAEVKIRGLRQFDLKYRSRMTETQRSEFLATAHSRFGYSPDTESFPRLPAASPAPSPPAGREPIDLIVGAVTSPNVRIVEGLLYDLTNDLSRREDVRLRVLLLENGGSDEARTSLSEMVRRYQTQGLRVAVIDRSRQAADLQAWVFGDHYRKLPRRASIALARTILQRHLYIAAKDVPRAVVWILDDDSRLDSLVLREDGSLVRERQDIPAQIRRIQGEDAAVVIGEVTGEPPLPFSSAVRVQLVDLYHNLEALARLTPEAPFPNRAPENASLRMKYRDFYYDLSRKETDHLETPFWYQPSASQRTAEQVFTEMARKVPDILRGIQVFRPLAHRPRSDLNLALVPSANRGPNTLVFDIEALREFPNAAPSIGTVDTRRSDMVWSLLNRFVGGRRVVSAPIPIRQDRSNATIGGFDFDTLSQDIHGYAVYSTLHDLFMQRAHRRQLAGKPAYGPDLLAFGPDDIETAERSFQKHVTERVSAFELSYLRIIGLLKALHKFTQADSQIPEGLAWWLTDDDFADAVDSIRSLTRRLSDIYTDDNLDKFRRRVQNYDIKEIRKFYTSLSAMAEEYRVCLPKSNVLDQAAAVLKSEFPHLGEMKTLGFGSEAVVFTDGRLVYKCILGFTGEASEKRLLEWLTGRLDGYKTLCALQEVRSVGNDLIIVYPFEDGQRYRGGLLDDMLTFLRECRTAGIVFRNVHPKNFIVTSGGLRFIDYGRDIRPYSDAEFMHMCRRAFLTWRFHFRSDLKQLMRTALTDYDLPELHGFEHFLSAIDPRPVHKELDDALRAMTEEIGPRTAVDYGCGRGALSRTLASDGIRVTAFDPDPRAADLWDSASGVEFLDASNQDALLQRQHEFDVVLCSRVLCTIEDPDELRRVLRNLRCIVSDTGSVLISVCNPFDYRIERTEGHQRTPPPNARYDEVFTYEECDPRSKRPRKETHRPLEVYRREFLRAGLAMMEAPVEIPCSDILNMRPASDYMVLRLKPVPDAPEVSLMIKTCYMEWKTIERQIRHLVSQLEGPRAFGERVVVVDQRTDGFTRQYEKPNSRAHRKAMDSLLSDGVVDRVIYAPQDEAAIRSIMRRWFDVDASDSHTVRGQPAFATLWGFEQCKGRYILQLDSDLLIGRQDRTHDYLADIVDVFQAHPNALFVSLTIFNQTAAAYSPDYVRVEVRGCMIDKNRIESVLPIPNDACGGTLQRTWHRAFHDFVESSRFQTSNGGDPRTFFIHVPNSMKEDTDTLFRIIDRVEQCFVPSAQANCVDLQGTWSDWAGPKRAEPYIFVISGRNIDPGQFRPCFDSVLSQTESNWGAIVIDDASTNGFGNYARTYLAPYRERVTIIENHERRGLMRNTWDAVTSFCNNPQSVILTLDPDDLLAGPFVLKRIEEEYDKGADVTIGSMLRLDKEAIYPVDLTDPRGSRGGNVWQHLRTFRKYLFDAICIEDLKMGEEWIELTSDWAFMLPIVEMSSRPVHIADTLYIYDPSRRERERYERERESAISRIIARPRYALLPPNEPSSAPNVGLTAARRCDSNIPS